MATLPLLSAGDRVAVLSPSFAAPGFAPAVHEQAMDRIRTVLALEPVEFPTTRMLGATPEARAADIHAAFEDPTIRAVFASIGGDDQITVIPHLDARRVAPHPTPFFGYSDNTHLLSWLWEHGVPAFHGGSTQVHLGPGPDVDPVHLRSLRAALFDGGELEITDPGESEDVGIDWLRPEALERFGERGATGSWQWAGPARIVEGISWGGCLEVIDELAMAGRLPEPDALRGGILILETSETLPPADLVRRWLRGLGERGVLAAVAGVLVARPPVSSLDGRPDAAERSRLRRAQREAVVETARRYNPDAVVCVGAPFGHTRPQWVLPYGGTIRLDGARQVVTAVYR